MDANIKRILYEVENNIQWGNDSLGNRPPYSFKDFTTSTKTPTELANEFLHFYERPQVYNQPARGKQAEEWYKYLCTIIPNPPEPPDPPKPPIPKFNKNIYKKWYLKNKKIRIKY